MDETWLSEQQVRDLYNGKEVVTKYTSVVDAMIGQTEQIEVKIVPIETRVLGA
ncbi:MAG: hypothetical protein ACXAC5_00360 [Promethearchaeota archaeon]|jgi:hypothetical protein